MNPGAGIQRWTGIICAMIPGLDGLRAIAFLTVLAGHSSDVAFGWMGVQLFFVLSGFLITGILIRMKESLPIGEYFKKFYGRRFLRIFPLYYLYLILISLAIWQKSAIPAQFLRKELIGVVEPQLSYAYFYIYDLFHASGMFVHTRFLAHLWSLSVEEQFYIVWPLVLLLTPKEKLKHLFLACIALGPVLRLAAYFIYDSGAISAPLGDPYTAIYVLPFSHVDAFAMGALLSQFPVTQPRKQLAILAVLIPLVGYLTQYLSRGAIRWDTLGYEYRLHVAYKFVWGYSLLNYLFALIIYNVARTSLFTRILDSFLFRYLGKISYGLYVYHYPITYFVLRIIPDWIPPQQTFLTDAGVFVITLCTVTIVASLSYYLVEKPINDLKDRFFPIRTP